MGKKRRVAKKDKAVFRLVHRSQHDPAAGAEGSSRVLVPVNENAFHQYDEIYQEQIEEEEDGPRPEETDEDLFGNDEEGEGKGKEKEESHPDYSREDFEYGYLGLGGDGYDYSQHMKPTGTGDIFIPAPKPRAYKKPIIGKNDNVPFLKEEKEKLPTSAFASVMQGDTSLLHLQNFDSKPYLDKDVLRYLEEEEQISDTSEFEGFDGELEDDFISLAEGAVAGGAGGDEGFGEGFGSAPPRRKPGFVPDPEDRYDDDDFSDDDDGPPELEGLEEDEEDEEDKQVNPVMMSERQKELEEQFQNVLEMYDEEDIGELDPEDPRLQGRKEIDQFQNVMEEHIETTGRQIRFGLGALDDEEGEQTRRQMASRLRSLNLPKETIEMAVENGATIGQQWDCQSITSLYSNTENHPSLIGEPQQIKLSSKTGIPLGYLGNHVNSMKKKAEEEEEEEDDDDDEDSDEDDEDRANLGEKRPKKENAEDKKARKQAAKKAKQEARLRKKETKQEYSREKTRQMSAQSKNTFQQQTQIRM